MSSEQDIPVLNSLSTNVPPELCVCVRPENKRSWYRRYEYLPALLGFITGYSLGVYFIRKK